MGKKKIKKLEKNEIKTYLKMVTSKFITEGFTVENLKVNNYDFIVATKKQFKWRSHPNQLNIFVVVGATDKITREVIEEYSKRSMDFALEQNEGLPTETQSGVVSFALLSSFDIDTEAKQWIQNRPDKRFVPFEMPIISDLKNNEVYYYEKNPIWGAIYHEFFKDFIKKHF